MTQSFPGFYKFIQKSYKKVIITRTSMVFGHFLYLIFYKQTIQQILFSPTFTWPDISVTGKFHKETFHKPQISLIEYFQTIFNATYKVNTILIFVKIEKKWLKILGTVQLKVTNLFKK